MNYESMLDDLRRWDSLFGGGVPTKADIESAMRGDVDADTLRSMRAYTHTLDRREITVTARCIDPDEWSIAEFEKEVASFIASVPANKRDGARVTLRGGYEESTELVVQYKRPQTDEEWALDVAHALMHARAANARDMAAYERVKRKLRHV